ncbi:Tripartite-type tricarboxylate transporter, receptor component TctC [Paracoccus alcaliphilus]|uniref:Tripartite-type tricarboxylate transporter, receptor component TctC n=1 Tax=Paracoccus alcaliphilus TaxID=34002 RepID=A0A1H8EWF3_9RHOB|nr:tripartite tricarboxylate transporter substrate binding protein [Paracoccus alcaliphilus]WCR20127.1 tripartite tricarboxylate transporter substrate binding protein [Paracoccus alcaliphilus]SEN23716.1 Tripartite-type tricarboxylate transporter, receptor component TctC [Paracoccus alcaliphilus]
MSAFRTLLFSAATITAVTGAAFAQTDWPSQTVTVIIGASPGGDTDFNARTFARYFEQVTGVSMVITNMPGGGATIATSAVRDAAPDGSTILFGHTGHLIVTEVSGLADYGIDDFEICCIPAVDQGAVFVTSAQSEITSVEELLERTNEDPNAVIFGTEFGGYSHLQGLLLMNETGAEMRFVDTGSAAEKITSLLGGRIHVAGIAYGAIQDYHEAGQMAVLGQPNAERNPLLGEISTFSEQGIDFVMNNPYIIAFPKGTDEAIIERMAEISAEISEIPEYASDLEQGFRQPVLSYGHEESLELLGTIRDNYMQYRDALQASR